MLREGVEIMRRMWTEDVVDYDGSYYSLKGALCQPKPVQDPMIPIIAEQFSVGLNTGLADTLDFLAGVLPGIHFQRLDTFSLLNAIHADPQAFGFEDAVTPCVSFGVQGNALCARPNGRLFWDVAPGARDGRWTVEA